MNRLLYELDTSLNVQGTLTLYCLCKALPYCTEVRAAKSDLEMERKTTAPIEEGRM